MRKQVKSPIYLMEMIDWLVFPYMMSLGKKLLVEFAIQAPIREQNDKEIVDK